MKKWIRAAVLVSLLTAIVGAGMLAYRHWQERFQGGNSAAPYQVTRVELKRDFGNAILTLEVDYDNRDGQADVTTTTVATDATDASSLRLVTATGRAPQLFFLPGVYPPVVKAGERARIEIIYWLDVAHLREALFLESNGHRVVVKNDTAFAIDRVENQTAVVFNHPDWNHQ